MTSTATPKGLMVKAPRPSGTQKGTANRGTRKITFYTQSSTSNVNRHTHVAAWRADAGERGDGRLGYPPNHFRSFS
jgi:hypothetical protein